jgi:hypothetical protein
MSQLYSYSRIGCYFTCPCQYAHRYIHKTPSPLPEGVELFMGSRFHEAMEYLYEQVPARIPGLEETLSRFDQLWEAGWKTLQAKQKQKGFATPVRIQREGEDINDYYNRAKLFLERYYEKYKPFDQDRTLGIEKRVVFSLDPDGQYRMQGYIDRVATDGDGTVWVHDYKTGSRKLNPEDARNEDQLALYQLALLQEPEFKNSNIRLVWHYVAFEEDAVITDRTPQELEGLRKRYIAKIQSIEKAKTFLPQTSALCGWCEFLPLCRDGQNEVERRRKKKEGADYVAAAPSSVQIPPVSIDVIPPTIPETPPSTAPVFSNPAPMRAVSKKKKKTDEGPTPQLPLF